MGFHSLQHIRIRRSAFRGRSPARHVPPSGFGYPLDGLLPSKPCRSCFVPAALMGFALRSLLLSKGFRPFPARNTHIPFLSPVYPHTRGAGAGSASRGFWALTLPRVPGNRHVFSTPTAGCSLGLDPSRALAEALIRISPDLLSRASSTGFTPRRRRPRVSISFRSVSSARVSAFTETGVRVGRPRRVLAPS